MLNSEKAIAGGVLVIAATILTALGQMTVSDWQSYTQWIFGIYVGGKAVQGGTSVIATAIAHKPPAPVQGTTNVTTTTNVTPQEPS